MTATDKSSLKDRADLALHDDFLRKAVRFTADRLRDRKLAGTDALGDWESWRERGRAIRTDVVANLDAHLATFQANVESRGGHVHRASDASAAAEIFADLARRSGAKLVAKSKSMVSEEVQLNQRLAEMGVDCIETDLGEWIVQLAKETPSHIIIPAIHKNRDQIQKLFETEGNVGLSPDTAVLAAFARRTLREKFQKADIGMTGCNFAIAETGSIVVFSNEGNARMVTTLPRVHVVMMGMERLLRNWDDLDVLSTLLPRSATGQKTTVYRTVLSGPRRPGEIDGPEKLHVILLDNGRSRILADPKFRDILNCIRCGACLNVCPVYRQIGGHAYDSVYPGPIGAVLTPLLNPGDKKAGELAFASSLCGACYEACPVKIPLHDMLVRLRARYVDDGNGVPAEAFGMKAFGAVASSPSAYRAAGAVGRRIPLKMLAAAPPAAAWASHRDLPQPPAQAFRDRWDAVISESVPVVVPSPNALVGAELDSAHPSPPTMNLLDRFQTELEAVGGHVVRAASTQHAADALRQILDKLAPKSIITWARSSFEGWAMDWLWDDRAAVPLVDGPRDVRTIARTADIGITTVDHAIAETGTLVLCTTPDRARSVSLLPTTHIALVRQSQIVGSSTDVSKVFAPWALADIPSSIHYITGPSRSADIENDLTIGVHGPAAVHVIVVDA